MNMQSPFYGAHNAVESIKAIFDGLPDAEALRVLYALPDRWSGSQFSDGVVRAVEILADDLAGECGFEDATHLLENF